jgi:hypothetical protein
MPTQTINFIYKMQKSDSKKRKRSKRYNRQKEREREGESEQEDMCVYASEKEVITDRVTIAFKRDETRQVYVKILISLI